MLKVTASCAASRQPMDISQCRLSSKSEPACFLSSFSRSFHLLFTRAFVVDSITYVRFDFTHLLGVPHIYTYYLLSGSLFESHKTPDQAVIDEDLLLDRVFLERWQAEITSSRLREKPEPKPSGGEASASVTWIIILVVMIVGGVVFSLALLYLSRRTKIRVDSDFEQQLSFAISTAYAEFQKVYPRIPSRALQLLDRFVDVTALFLLPSFHSHTQR